MRVEGLGVGVAKYEVPALGHLARALGFWAQGAGCRDKALAGPGLPKLAPLFSFSMRISTHPPHSAR